MSPTPNGPHQDFAYDLRDFLKRHWGRPTGGLVRGEFNLTTPADEADWRSNYRVPDVVLVAADRRHIDKRTYLVGAPTVVVEIYSPGDESYDKLDFYRDLGVPEVWIFHRDTKETELRVLTGGQYQLAGPDSDGWHVSPATGAAFRPTGAGTLDVRVGDAVDIIPTE